MMMTKTMKPIRTATTAAAAATNMMMHPLSLSKNHPSREKLRWVVSLESVLIAATASLRIFPTMFLLLSSHNLSGVKSYLKCCHLWEIRPNEHAVNSPDKGIPQFCSQQTPAEKCPNLSCPFSWSFQQPLTGHFIMHAQLHYDVWIPYPLLVAATALLVDVFPFLLGFSNDHTASTVFLAKEFGPFQRWSNISVSFNTLNGGPCAT